MKKLNNMRIERINSRVFKDNRDRFLDFGNMRHDYSYAKWKVVIRALGGTEKFMTDRTWLVFSNPLPFANKNSQYLKDLQESLNGEFLFTYHKHYSNPYKQYDMRGILFKTPEHKALFILNFGDILSYPL